MTVSTSHVHTWAAFDQVITPPVENRAVTSSPKGTPSGTSFGIVARDDDHATVDLVRLYLERDQHQVTVAYDGQTALRLAATAQFDLVVLDWMLPDMDSA